MMDLVPFPTEINNLIFTYLSHPVADISKPWAKQYELFQYQELIDFQTYIKNYDHYTGWWWYSDDYIILVEVEFISYLNDFYDF